MAGSIDDIDASCAKRDRGILGHDGDAAFAFERVGVHHAIHHLFVGAEHAGLAQQGIDQGGFPVIDVGNNGKISDIWSSHIGGRAKC